MFCGMMHTRYLPPFDLLSLSLSLPLSLSHTHTHILFLSLSLSLTLSQRPPVDGAIGDFHLYKKLAPDTKDLLDKVQQVLKRLVKGKAQGVVLDTFKRFRWITESRSMHIQFKDFQRGLQRMAFYDLDERCAELRFALRVWFRRHHRLSLSSSSLPPYLPVVSNLI